MPKKSAPKVKIETVTDEDALLAAGLVGAGYRASAADGWEGAIRSTEERALREAEAYLAEEYPDDPPATEDEPAAEESEPLVDNSESEAVAAKAAEDAAAKEAAAKASTKTSGKGSS